MVEISQKNGTDDSLSWEGWRVMVEGMTKGMEWTAGTWWNAPDHLAPDPCQATTVGLTP